MYKFLLGISFIFVLLGASGIMDEMGRIQPVGIVLMILGMLGMLFIGREVYIDEFN